MNKFVLDLPNSSSFPSDRHGMFRFGTVIKNIGFFTPISLGVILENWQGAYSVVAPAL